MGLQANVVPVSEITSQQRDEMYGVMTRYFDDVHRPIFERDLDEKSWVFLLTETETGKICGFTTLLLLDAVIDNKPVRAFYSGDTVLEHAYRSSLALERAWIAFAAEIIEQYPNNSWYWFMICNSFRSYRYLSVFAKKFHPHPILTTPAYEKKVMDTFARKKFGDAYDQEKGVVRIPMGCRLKPGICDINERELRNPFVAYFQEMNPEWHEGVELACLMSLELDNYQPAVFRFLKQELDLLRKTSPILQQPLEITP